jgi:hypothetical protein
MKNNLGLITTLGSIWAAHLALTTVLLMSIR